MSTKLFIILDMSGSMGGIVESTIDGFNEYIEGLRVGNRRDYTASLTLFNHASRTVYKHKHIKDVPYLTRADYEPHGSTALYDAIANTLMDAQERVLANDKALVVIITDGHENASQRFSLRQVRDMIGTLTARDNWSFVFLGANIDAFEAGSALGISSMNTARYQTTEDGVKNVFRTMTSSTNNLWSAQGMSTKSYFTEAEQRKMEKTK